MDGWIILTPQTKRASRDSLAGGAGMMNMDWLQSPRVLLGLAVNGAYLIFCLFTSVWGGLPRESVLQRPEPVPQFIRRPPVTVRMPPRTGPTKATTFYAEDANQVSVYPKVDLTLIEGPKRKLLFSPIFSVQGREVIIPQTVHLRFYSFTPEQTYTVGSPLVINADDTTVWFEPGVSHSVSVDERGEVVESVGQVVPYEVFLEMIGARRVRISLGHNVLELTREQVEALRDMHRCVEEAACR